MFHIIKKKTKLIEMSHVECANILLIFEEL